MSPVPNFPWVVLIFGLAVGASLSSCSSLEAGERSVNDWCAQYEGFAGEWISPGFGDEMLSAEELDLLEEQTALMRNRPTEFDLGFSKVELEELDQSLADHEELVLSGSEWAAIDVDVTAGRVSEEDAEKRRDIIRTANAQNFERSTQFQTDVGATKAAIGNLIADACT